MSVTDADRSSRRAIARCGRRATTRPWSRRSCSRSARGSSPRRGIGPGMRVLDVAAGTGNASLPAARARRERDRERPDARAAGRGPAPRRGRGLELEWVEADAEHLPFEDGAFDVVMSCIGVMFAPHHQAAADELVRVCRPGGTLALLSWTPEGMLGALFRTMGQFAPPPPARRPASAAVGERGAPPRPPRRSRRAARSERDVLEITAFEHAHDYGEHFRSLYGPTIAVRGERAQERPRGGVRRRAGRVLRRVGPRRRGTARASRRSTCSPSARARPAEAVVRPSALRDPAVRSSELDERRRRGAG